MTLSTEEQLETLKSEVREAIVRSTTEALAILAKALPTGRPKHNQVLLLTSRAGDIANHDINDTLVPHLLDVLRNELRRDVLTFTDHLTLTDFGPEAPPRPELKPGHLLYKVPARMALRETYECLVRIAHQLSQVLAGIELDDSVSFEALPVAEVMEVEVIDPSPAGEPAFDILLLSDGEQLVDEYSATDWVFNIRPLREGEHRLVLKISVLITVKGKERTKNIVLQRPISVTAEAVEAVTVALVRVVDAEPAGFEKYTEPPRMEVREHGASPQPPTFTPGEEEQAGGEGPPRVRPAPAPVPQPAPPRGRSRRMRYLSLVASILLLFSLAWWLLPGGSNTVDTTIETVDPIRQPNVGDGPGKVVEEKDSLRRDSLRRDSLRF